MESITDLINGIRSGQTAYGRMNRIQYLPYKMDVALSVVEKIAQTIDPKFKMIEEVSEVYKELIRYFHADPEFKGDLTKGILLMGPTGTGKTIAMQIMSIYRQIDDTKFVCHGKLYRMNYEVIDVNRLVALFMENAFDGVEIYCRRYVTCLDDIGTEDKSVKYYGNVLDVVGHVIAERYSKGLLTFGTTNFPLNVLEEMYDDRIISRMHAMFNFMTLKCEDFRRKKKKVNNANSPVFKTT